MRKIIRIGSKGKRKFTSKEKNLTDGFEARVALIQALIPVGLEKVAEDLEREVKYLAGTKHSRNEGLQGHHRWGSQPRSIYLADQKLGIIAPRVRNSIENEEVILETLRLLQQPRNGDEGVLRKILVGLSCRNYEACAEAVPEAFGMSASSVSRRFIRGSARKLKELMERDLSQHDFVALFMDGKTFAEDEMIMALGVTMSGEKMILGFIQAATENERVIREFLNGLVERGLKIEEGLLCVIDGSKGLRSALKKVFADRALIMRCQWHKRENVVSYLPQSLQTTWRKKLQQAYEKPTYQEAKAALNHLKLELKLINESAVRSLEEGLEETLTLHRLGLFQHLGISLKTTNCIESIMSLVAGHTDKVDYWRNSSQKQRWVATALLEIEPRLRKIKGYRYLPALRHALKQQLHLVEEVA